MSKAASKPSDAISAKDAKQIGVVLYLYFQNIKGMVARDAWMNQWAKEAASEIPLPKTRDEFEAALKAALSAGAFFGLDECRQALPK